MREQLWIDTFNRAYGSFMVGRQLAKRADEDKSILKSAPDETLMAWAGQKADSVLAEFDKRFSQEKS